MTKVYITNRTGRPIQVKHWYGDWTDHTKLASITPYSIGFWMGTMVRPGIGRNRAWVGLQSDQAVGPDLQAYVSVGNGGPVDYAIQYFDAGENRDDRTVSGTVARLYDDDGDGDEDVYLTIEHTFDAWMSRIPNSRRLHELTIPGTHDSGTFRLIAPSQCQSTSIEEQLYMGVRYFDIRLDSSMSNYPVVHGPVHGSTQSGYDLAGVTRILRNFLIKPTGGDSRRETVILQLKIDRGNDDGAENHAIIDILKRTFQGVSGGLNHLYLKSLQAPIPTIEDLRGKLVVLRRFDLDNENSVDSCTPVKYFAHGALFKAWAQGGSSSAPWPDVFEYSSFEWPDQTASPTDFVNRNRMSFVIQDGYDFDPGSKAQAAVASLKAAVSGAYDGAWYLNFSSTANGGPPYGASMVNPVLTQFLAMMPSRPTGHGYGTVLMDFANVELVRALVEKNF